MGNIVITETSDTYAAAITSLEDFNWVVLVDADAVEDKDWYVQLTLSGE